MPNLTDSEQSNFQGSDDSTPQQVDDVFAGGSNDEGQPVDTDHFDDVRSRLGLPRRVTEALRLWCGNNNGYLDEIEDAARRKLCVEVVIFLASSRKHGHEPPAMPVDIRHVLRSCELAVGDVQKVGPAS